MRLIFIVLFFMSMPVMSLAQDKTFSLSAPQALVDTGFLKHLLPRFSLKTGIRISVVGETDAADAAFGPDGTPVFEGAGAVWHLSVTDDPMARRFVEWLRSDIGKRTIEAFQTDGKAVFTANVVKKAVQVAVSFDGDPVAGERLSMAMCGRCHVINHTNRMNGLGSTPSFAVLRTFRDWEQRFSAFFTLNPHPAFTQVKDVTDPFDAERPSPIAPVEMTLDDLEAILAYVAGITPADLGAPIQSQ